EPTIVAGLDVARAVFHEVDNSLNIIPYCYNGERLEAGRRMLGIEGDARSILKSERVALNFLGRMCGIATLTRQFVDELTGTKAQVLDTRKTKPGLRILEKSAPVISGARNHRF